MIINLGRKPLPWNVVNAVRKTQLFVFVTSTVTRSENSCELNYAIFRLSLLLASELRMQRAAVKLAMTGRAELWVMRDFWLRKLYMKRVSWVAAPHKE